MFFHTGSICFEEVWGNEQRAKFILLFDKSDSCSGQISTYHLIIQSMLQRSAYLFVKKVPMQLNARNFFVSSSRVTLSYRLITLPM